MKIREYFLLLSITFGAFGYRALHASSSSTSWTADEFWQEGVEWYLDEHKESICGEIMSVIHEPIEGFEWVLIKKDLRNLYLQVTISIFANQEEKYLFDDQALKYLLDRWFELCLAEGKTAEYLLEMD